ncbi:MAG: ATP-dependent RecD-like DNA helicase [Acidobacteria bacterium]|nr:ATP-dependent RecD-like DNA helicase [Acidobacteriota bacterium]
MADIKKVKVQKKIFFSEESGYGVFKVTVKGAKEPAAVIVGSLLDVNEGDYLEIKGEEILHPIYGKQIKIQEYKVILPDDKEGIITYLSSGRFKGLGKKTAEKIVDHFGSSTIELLRTNPARLHEVKGLKKRNIEEIKKNFKDGDIIRELTLKLAPYGIGNETIFKIYKEFGEDSLIMLEQNAYFLIERVKGIGFRTADTIAMRFGVARDDVNRIRAGIVFLVNQAEQQNGDLYIEEKEMAAKCASLLDINPEAVTSCIDTMVERNELVREETPERVVLSYKNFAIEKMIAHRLYNLANPPAPLPPIKVNFNIIFKKLSLELTDEQKQAVISTLNNQITVITGGPGTGKTTIIRAIIEAFQENSQVVSIAAPTGRAAKRIEEASYYKASTIHRLLKIDPGSREFVHNENNPLRVDAVIVDEFSMVDSFIFYSLLKAISRHTRLIIIGDKDQLPSVGPGNVLRDIIKCGYFNTIYLNRNFRQTENSLIIENAYRINEGKKIVKKPYSKDLDFVFIKVTNETHALEKVQGIIGYYKDVFYFNSPDFQVLSPMYRGEAGIDNLNNHIQERFNPEPFVLKKEKTAFKRNDKVMQLRNNYEKMIFNGEQGIISDYDAIEKALSVNFDGTIVKYHISELEELTLAYAVSVHKAQGSEYDMLVLVLLPSHSIMLNRELFYTAVTRARKKIFLVSDEDTMERAINNDKPSTRKTLLSKRLQEIFQQPGGLC